MPELSPLYERHHREISVAITGAVTTSYAAAVCRKNAGVASKRKKVPLYLGMAVAKFVKGVSFRTCLVSKGESRPACVKGTIAGAQAA